MHSRSGHTQTLACACCRQQGLGRELLRSALAWAVKNRRPQLATLHVDASNAAAIRLYTSAGMARERTLEDYYAPKRDAHVMQVDMQVRMQHLDTAQKVPYERYDFPSVTFPTSWLFLNPP